MADQATEDEKKKKAPKPKFGQILNLGSGKMWTVESSEGGSVTIAQRDGDKIMRRQLTEDEYTAAKENPLPNEFQRLKPPRGLSIGSYVDAGRVVGYDAATGEAQVEGPKGTSWVPNRAPATPDAAVPSEAATAATGASGGFVGKSFSDLTFGAVSSKKQDKPTSVETNAPAIEPVIATPVAATPSVVASHTVSVSEPSSKPIKSGKSEESSVSVSTSVTSAAPAAASAAPAAASASVSVKATSPTIRDTREQMRGAMKSVAVQAKQLYKAPASSAARGGDQQQLYARAADALQVMGSRVASQRAAIQDLQGEATVLRDEIAGLNAQAAGSAVGQTAGPYRAPADVSGRMQTAQKKLGDTNNRIALSRFNLQADEARVQQLKIGTNLMRNAAPEVAAGRMPASVVGMVEQSIPQDIPPPSPARAAALIASMSEASPSEPPPQNEEGAGGGGSRVAGGGREVGAPRSYSAVPPPVLSRGQGPSRARQNIPKRGLTLPPSTSDFLSAQNADRKSGNYVPGMGASDAREMALGSSGTASGSSVLRTKPKSYSDLPAPDEAEDLFTPGGGGASSEFAKKQRESQETQEQFLPGTTPDIEGTTFEKEADRAQGVRTEPEEDRGPDQDALRAAAFDAARQRARAASMSAMLTEGEEEAKKSGAASALKGLKQAESVRRNVARMWDLFNAALAVATTVTIIGALLEIGELLVSMNGRVLSAMFFRNPRSVVRKFLPAAQFPYEIAAIIALDLIIFTFIFLSLCIAMLPIIILVVLMTLGVGGLAFVVSGS